MLTIIQRTIVYKNKKFIDGKIEYSEGEFEIKDDSEIYLPKDELTLGYAF